MKDYYSTAISLIDGGIQCSIPQKVDVSVLNDQKKKDLEQDGHMVLLNIEHSAMMLISVYPVIRQFNDLFALGIGIALSQDKDEYFKKYLLSKYDYTVDCLNKLNKDPEVLDLPYVE